MNGYCHERRFILRYTDFDAFDRIKISSLLSLAQEAAASSADELSFGYEDLKPKGYGFITVATVGEIKKDIRIGDEIFLKTWPQPPRHVIFERDYLLENKRGETVVKMASRWCLVDLKDFTLLPPEKLGKAHEKCPYNPQKVFERANFQIEKLDDTKEFCLQARVGASRLDHYFHLNNTFYADMFMDCLSLRELSRPVKSFQISYLNQAKEGVELSFFSKKDGGAAIFEAFSGDEPISRFKVCF